MSKQGGDFFEATNKKKEGGVNKSLKSSNFLL